MNNKAPRDEILETAADWCDRLESLTPVERRQLNAWIAADLEHARAYDTMRRTMLDVALLEAAADLPSEATSTSQPHPGAWLARLFAPKANWGILLGAAVAAGVVAIVLLRPPAPAIAPTPQILATKTGERSTVTLADKSVVYLNADTRIAVSYSEHGRLLNLSKGEAIFQVSKDKARPFRVVTDNATVTAVGTRFGVDRVGDAVEVRVYEGTVRVDGLGTDHRAVSGGQWILLDPKRGITGGNFAPDAYPNWRTGWLEADNMPLTYVIARLNRYTNDKIEISDRSLGDVELSGRFRLDNTAQTLKQISSLLDVETDKRDHEVLLRRRHE
ncbi:MAG: FecR domain-containing protein [Rhizomicrobium sp.]|nr:FecR domain-containing protein [Rhizomicrobium sp.]